MAFPNFKNKHAESAMFSPREFLQYTKKHGKYPKDKPPTGIILCYSRRFLRHILDNHRTRKIAWFGGGELYYISVNRSRLAVLGNFGIGAPMTGSLVDEMVAWGVKKFISVGEAGTLQKHINIGDLVVCDKAIRDEGLSHHYIKSSKYAYPDQPLTKRLSDVLIKLGRTPIVGGSWTIDAPYRETVAEAKQYQKEGILTVEMEAAALFAVASYRKAKMAALFTISDSLAAGTWEPKFHKSEDNWATIFKVAVEALID